MGEVRTQWDRLVSVLQQRRAHSTLAAIAPALPEDQVAGVLDASNGVRCRRVYGDLSEWLSCHNGFFDGQWARLFPDLDLLSAAQIAQIWSMMLSTHPAPSGYPLYSGPPAYGFIRQYVPIAERDGYLWVVDGRPGESTHSVIAFDKVDADDDATTWPSIGALLADVATAIDTGEAFDGSTPTIENGELTWR
ncbi:hypothetical protein SAMN05445060_3823 [Williamsia sterculiae]|uniref:Cell wall assembly regulator SMI1 n=1 Tax=Williamsia sterculiae TaxID=1344003 RepID=A0A1N7HAI6_9NOCA|nr:hypothetical protein SAMN05445060_3823 [Williamsia sterculiae]